ncbi:MAG: S-layer homology domain-containing protein [Candidatus Margulisiibacteriota bacterium]
MKKLSLLVFGFVLFFLPLSLNAQEFKVSTTPNPAVPGQKLRFTVQTKTPIQKASIVFSSTTKISLNAIGKGLYTGSYLVPASTKPGAYSAKLYVVLPREEKGFLITLSYTVGSDPSKTDSGTTDQIGQSKSLASMDLNIKIDELETSVDQLQQNKKTLENRIKDLQKQLQDLKNAKPEKKPASPEQSQAIKDIEEKTKNLKQLQDSLAAEKKELAHKTEAYQKQLFDLSNTEKTLKAKEQKLSEIESQLSVRQTGLTEAERRLSQQQFVVDQREEQLSQREMNLSKIEENLTQQDRQVRELEQRISKEKESLSQKQTQITAKEATLGTLSQQIKDKDAELREYNKRLENQEMVLSSQKSEIDAAKKTLGFEQNKLNKIRNQLSQQKQAYDAESQKLAAQIAEYEKQKSKTDASNQAQQNALNQRKLALDQAKIALDNKRSELEKNEASQAAKQEELNKTSQALTTLYSLFKERQDYLTSVKGNMEALKADFDAKYEYIKELRTWVTKKNEVMEKAYVSAQKESASRQQKLEERLEEMQGLSKSLENQSKYVGDLNLKLIEQNEKLRQQLETVKKPSYPYRFSITPGLGYHFFSSTTYSSGPEAGLKVGYILNDQWSLEAGGSIISTQIQSSSVNKFLFGYTVDVMYRYPISATTELYALPGIAGIVNNSNPNFFFGAGLRFNSSDDFASFCEFRKGTDTVIGFGFEQKIKNPDQWFAQAAPIEQPVKLDLPVQKPVVDGFSVALKVPSNRYQYTFENPRFTDMDNHWALKEVLLLTKLKILDGREETVRTFDPKTRIYSSRIQRVFDPRATITKAEMTKLLVLTAFLDEIYDEPTTTINYTVVGKPNALYETSLTVQTPSGDVVSTLASGREKPSSHALIWEGDDPASKKKLDQGTYTFVLTATDASIPTAPVVRTETRDLVLVNLTTPMFESTAPDAPFKDIPGDYWCKPYINTAVQFGIFESGTTFDPKKPVRRIEFIDAIAKTLLYWGAQEPKINLDLGFYKDAQKIPKEYLSIMPVYVNELGYGGDPKHYLDPLSPINRAEAAILLSKLIDWRKAHPGVTKPH